MDKNNDYYMSVKKDLIEYFNQNSEGYIDEERAEELRDEAFTADSVTGNGSNYYTGSDEGSSAANMASYNLDLFADACREYGSDAETICKHLDEGLMTIDIVIRCYVLDQVFDDAVEEWNESHPQDEEEELEIEA